VTKLELASGARIAFLTRLAEGILPTAETVLQEGDLVHVMLRDDTAATAEAVFASGPEVH
jgi:trk system potassium uptake protein TrkA